MGEEASLGRVRVHRHALWDHHPIGEQWRWVTRVRLPLPVWISRDLQRAPCRTTPSAERQIERENEGEGKSRWEKRARYIPRA